MRRSHCGWILTDGSKRPVKSVNVYRRRRHHCRQIGLIVDHGIAHVPRRGVPPGDVPAAPAQLEGTPMIRRISRSNAGMPLRSGNTLPTNGPWDVHRGVGRVAEDAADVIALELQHAGMSIDL